MNRRISYLRNIKRTRDKRNPEYQRVFYTGKTNAGVYITPDNAITVPAVWAAIRYLSESIAKLPWTLNETVKGGIQERVNNPINTLIKRRVSNEYSSFQFRETLTHWALRWGNGYAEIERDIMGRPIALHPIHPSKVAVYRNPETYEIYYEVSTGEARVVLEQMDMFHIRGFGENIVGVNVMAYAAESIGLSKAAILFGAGFFGNGANPSGIITMKKPMSTAGLKNVREAFNELYGGPVKGNRTAVLDNEMTYQQLSVAPDNSQFIQTQQHQIEEVCRWIGVPPHKIYHLLRTSFNSIEHQSIEVVTDSLLPWEQRFCDEADFKLLGQNRNNLHTDMDFRRLLRGDTTTRIAYYNAMRNTGSMSANEIRAQEGMASIGPDGDAYLVQSQYTTLDQVINPPEPEPVAIPEPEDEELTEEQIAEAVVTENLRKGGFL